MLTQIRRPSQIMISLYGFLFRLQFPCQGRGGPKFAAKIYQRTREEQLLPSGPRNSFYHPALCRQSQVSHQGL